VPDSQPDRHNNLQLPPAADQWYPLKDPPGTETIVLAAHTEPIQPEQIVAAIQTALAPTGRPPSLQPTCLAILQPKAVQFLFDHSRTLDLDEPVKSDPGALQQLVRALAQKWSAVSGVTFPHVFAKQENPQ
jgi:hypothetical protein